MTLDFHKNVTFIKAFTLAAGALFLLPRLLAAVEIAPASAVDIVAALGPDAKGLSIHQERLPDLFTLTSSRIDENATRFIIEEPYLGGHWKGGRAVIEFARDLSYTIVSVYDKAGRRQRIYSVRSNYEEHLAQARAQDMRAAQALDSVEEAQSTRSSRDERQPAPAQGSSQAYEWDEARGDYVPTGTAKKSQAAASREAVDAGESVQQERVTEREAAPASRKSSRRRRYRQSSSAEVAAVPAASKDVWLPTGGKATSKAGSSAGAVTAGGTKWVERKEVSVPESKPSRETARKPPWPGQSSERVVVPKNARPAGREAVESRELVNIDDENVPSTEELIAGSPSAAKQPAESEAVTESPQQNTRALSADSDAWVPKGVKTPSNVEADLAALPKDTKQVARVPKTPSVNDAFLNVPLSNEPVTQAGDTWVPKKGAVDAPSAEAQMNHELKRIREEEKQQKVVASKPLIKRDVNNPEEGVLPVSSFEKFSGSMYGRHREYERRFYPGKKAKSKAPEHDFYVDEVDRKQEIHNIYFYQHRKGKAPKLVAVQKHENVTFRSNYDIDTEDSGDLRTY